METYAMPVSIKSWSKSNNSSDKFEFTFQASNLRQILEQTKEPAAETLKAASAYETITNEIEMAQEAANKATEASNNLAAMVIMNF